MPIFKRLWAKISGGDAGKKYPQQQTVALGRTGNCFIIYPYGMYCDVPNDELALVIADGAAIPATVNRPAGVARGEPTIFNPGSGSSIIMRSDGSIEITSDTVTFSGDVTLTGTLTADTDVIAAGISLLTHIHTQANDSGGNTEQPTNPPS